MEHSHRVPRVRHSRLLLCQSFAAALRDSGYRGPVILSYDFSTEERRFATLASKDPALSYCPDYADANQIRAAIDSALGD